MVKARQSTHTRSNASSLHILRPQTWSKSTESWLDPMPLWTTSAELGSKSSQVWSNSPPAWQKSVKVCQTEEPTSAEPQPIGDVAPRVFRRASGRMTGQHGEPEFQWDVSEVGQIKASTARDQWGFCTLSRGLTSRDACAPRDAQNRLRRITPFKLHRFSSDSIAVMALVLPT